MLDINMVSFLLFLLIIAVLIYRNRKGVKLEGVVIIKRTSRGKRAIDRIAKRYSRFWNILSFIGIIVAIPALIFSTYFILNNSFAILSGEVKEGVRLVLPWPTAEARFEPGLLLMPWWFWILGIAAVVIPHELSHGIMCRLEKVRIKSLGWLLLIFIPGAFVEPDERQLKKSRTLTKLKVYAAGSFANFAIAFVVWMLGFALISSFFSVGGIIPSGAIKDYPVANASIGGAILKINNETITSPSKLSMVLDEIPPGTNITIETTKGIYNIITAKHPEMNRSFIGVAGPYSPYYVVLPAIKNTFGPFGEVTLNFLRELFVWIFILSLGIGLINLLPIKPLDGGLIFEEIAMKFSRHGGHVTKFVSVLILILLLFNLFGPVLMGA
jgi:membrane-associated protease RseP (regulator of RpoE activity)